MDNSTLHIKHIKSDGTAVLEEPELNLQPGQIMALEGPLGSGRTTLVKAILGLGDPGNRRIHVGGFDPRTDELEARRLIAYVSEDLIFPATLTPSGVGTILSLTHPTWRSTSFNDYCTSFDIPLKEPLKSFTPHMKFALMLAAALSRDSRLLLIDGAVTRQDESMQQRLPVLLKDYAAGEGRSVLFTCGAISSGLEQITDRVFQLRDGRIQPNEAMEGPEHA